VQVVGRGEGGEIRTIALSTRRSFLASRLAEIPVSLPGVHGAVGPIAKGFIAIGDIVRA